MRDVEVASVVAEAVVNFKESEEFTALLKKDYHNDYDVGAVEIFYNIWAKYWDLDYTFLGGEFTNLIGKWLEAEKLNDPDPAPLSPSPSPLAKDIIGAESVPIGASKPQSVANANEEVATSNPLLIVEELIGEATSRVTGRKH